MLTEVAYSSPMRLEFACMMRADVVECYEDQENAVSTCFEEITPYGRRPVMFWTGVTFSYRTEIILIKNGSLNAHNYIIVILCQLVKMLFLWKIMTHSSGDVDAYMEEVGIRGASTFFFFSCRRHGVNYILLAQNYRYLHGVVCSSTEFTLAACFWANRIRGEAWFLMVLHNHTLLQFR